MSNDKLRVNKGVPSPIRNRKPKVTQHSSTFTQDNGSGKNYSWVIGLVIMVLIVGIAAIVFL